MVAGICPSGQAPPATPDDVADGSPSRLEIFQSHHYRCFFSFTATTSKSAISQSRSRSSVLAEGGIVGPNDVIRRSPRLCDGMSGQIECGADPESVHASGNPICKICRASTTYRIDAGFRRQDGAYRLDAGRADHRPWKYLQSIGARLAGGEALRGGQPAGPRRHLQRFGFPDDIWIEMGGDDNAPPRVGNIADVLNAEDGARPDGRHRSKGLRQQGDAFKRFRRVQWNF